MSQPVSGKDSLLSTWATLAQDIATSGGHAIVPLHEDSQRVVARAFDISRRAFDAIDKTKNPCDIVRCICSTDDSAHATGYHPASSSTSMSRYNARREGFVFSDGNLFSVQDVDHSGAGVGFGEEFESSMRALQDCLHKTANRALQAIEKDLCLPPRWFQDHLDYEGNHSQWHIKRYVCDKIPDSVFVNEQESVLLPSHTDPSLLSVVILDQPGVHEGAMGLQVYQNVQGQNKREWKELSYHGHGVVVIFIGSVMSVLGGTLFPLAKHRVVQAEGVQKRMAATFFLRPEGSAQLRVPPSPQLKELKPIKKNMTFGGWSSKVSKKYMKQTKKSSNTDSTKY